MCIRCDLLDFFRERAIDPEDAVAVMLAFSVDIACRRGLDENSVIAMMREGFGIHRGARLQ